MSHILNPIIPGFHPDPSICRDGDSFYIVNSSFSYFPGVPIFTTKDFCNIKQIGNVLTDDEQLPLGDAGTSAGIYAPTVRYHNGLFYMITTNVSGQGNFICTAKDPCGKWSRPVKIEGTDGIDPSIFFDDDGKLYFIGTHENPDGPRYFGDNVLYIRELDSTTFQITGTYENEKRFALRGAMSDANWAEGPHLYKKDGWYYIMFAEGGTGFNHSVMTARSRNIYGAYELNPCNPIISHRNLGTDYPVQYTGHADMTDAPDGSWYMVLLASRPCDGCTGLGRETFLAQVDWENGWPVVNKGYGRLRKEFDIPLTAEIPSNMAAPDMYYSHRPSCTHFYAGLPPEFVTLRNPEKDFYTIENGILKLKPGQFGLSEKKSVSYLALRQTSYDYLCETRLKLPVEEIIKKYTPDFVFEAGLAIYQSEEANLRVVIQARNFWGKPVFVLKGIKHCEKDENLFEFVIDDYSKLADGIELKIEQHAQYLDVFYSYGKVSEMCCARIVDVHFLSTEMASGFVGNTLGMYACSNVSQENKSALCTGFLYFNLENL